MSLFLRTYDRRPCLRGTEAAEKADIMEKAFRTGCRIFFFDSHRRPHEALVTNWFHGGPDGQTVDDKKQEALDRGVTSEVWLPCCNVVYVSSDESKQDPYGRQTERASSVPYGRHMGSTPFLGMCWCWPDELEEAMALAAVAI